MFSGENTVSQTVNKAIATDMGLGGGLVRMHFHNYFARVCHAPANEHEDT